MTNDGDGEVLLRAFVVGLPERSREFETSPRSAT